jgi:hypothetical protein
LYTHKECRPQCTVFYIHPFSENAHVKQLIKYIGFLGLLFSFHWRSVYIMIGFGVFAPCTFFLILRTGARLTRRLSLYLTRLLLCVPDARNGLLLRYYFYIEAPTKGLSLGQSLRR